MGVGELDTNCLTRRGNPQRQSSRYSTYPLCSSIEKLMGYLGVMTHATAVFTEHLLLSWQLWLPLPEVCLEVSPCLVYVSQWNKRTWWKQFKGRRTYFGSWSEDTQPVMEGKLWQPWQEEHIANTPHFSCQNKERTKSGAELSNLKALLQWGSTS